MTTDVDRTLGPIRMYLPGFANQTKAAAGRAERTARTTLSWVARDEPTATLSLHAPPRQTPRQFLRSTVRFVNDHLDEQLLWQDIATHLNLKPFTFGRHFKRMSGMTPHQYIIRCRLRRALRMLGRQELTLANIALEVGCSCQSHLTTLFRKHLGITPGAVRTSHAVPNLSQGQPARERFLPERSRLFRDPHATRVVTS